VRLACHLNVGKRLPGPVSATFMRSVEARSLATDDEDDGDDGDVAAAAKEDTRAANTVNADVGIIVIVCAMVQCARAAKE
jgi:hypothetical protein